MARPIRVHRAGSTVHVFNRTLGQRHRLKPEPKMVAGIHEILIRTQRRHKMRLVAFAFLSNHFHLVLRIRHTHQLSAFMRDVQSAVALLSYEQFKGPRLFWVPRFRSQELCTPTAIRDTVRYVSSHGTKEGIVPSPTEWAGPTCARQMADPRLAPRMRVVDPKTGIERVQVLRLSRVPEDDRLPFPKWQRQQAELIADIEAAFAGRTFTGMERAMAIPALWGPPQLDRGDRVRMVSWKCTDEFGGKDEAAYEAAKAHYDSVVEQRAKAMDGTVRAGIADIEHPVGAVFSHVIPCDLRGELVGCANAGRPPIVQGEGPGPGMAPTPPSGGVGPQNRGPIRREDPPKPPNGG